MTQRSWPWSTVAGLGDGSAELNEAYSREFLALYFQIQDPTVEGVSKGVLNELAVTGIATPLAVGSGSAICYGLYLNDADTTIAVGSPAVGTTGGRVVLQTNWAGTGGAPLEARTRLAVIYSADGVPAIPALTQAFGTTWEISLATFTVTTVGVITVTDDRTFRRSTAMVDTAELINLAVETAKIDNLAVTAAKIGALAVETAKINNLAVTEGKIGALAVTSGKIGANAVIAGKIAAGAVEAGDIAAGGVSATNQLANDIVDNTKLRNSAALSVIGRGVNSVGDPSDMVCGNEDWVLRRKAGALAFGLVYEDGIANAAVTAAKILGFCIVNSKMADDSVDGRVLAPNSVDDTIAGNRVPQFYRRQGGDAADWDVFGTNNYTPTMVRMQSGSIQTSGAGDVTVTFPVAFSSIPIVIAQVKDQLRVVIINTITATTFNISAWDLTPARAVNTVQWLAIGTE